MEHSRLPPSGAARWIQCPGSRAMCEAYPEQPSESSEEGTLAHAVNVAVMRNLPIPAGATEEMLDGADLWMDTVGIYQNPHIEERIPCQGVHPECWGAPDFWTVEATGVHVADYKFGHRFVEVFENWQLLTYAMGVVFKMRLTHFDTAIRLTIVQPRSYHRDGPVRHWDLTLGQAQQYFEKLRAAGHAAMEDKAPTRTGDECLFCSARHVCPTLRTSAYGIVDIVGQNLPFDLPSPAIGAELTILREAETLLSARISGLENEIMGRIKLGQAIPGWMTEQGQGREKWKCPVEEIISLGSMMGVDVSKPGAITPKQAIKAGLPADLVREYSETPAGAVKLVIDDGSKARHAFNN